MGLAPGLHVCEDKCKSRPCAGRPVCLSLELTIYSCLFFLLRSGGGSGAADALLSENAITRLSQDKSLFLSLSAVMN